MDTYSVEARERFDARLSRTIVFGKLWWKRSPGGKSYPMNAGKSYPKRNLGPGGTDKFLLSINSYHRQILVIDKFLPPTNSLLDAYSSRRSLPVCWRLRSVALFESLELSPWYSDLSGEVSRAVDIHFPQTSGTMNVHSLSGVDNGVSFLLSWEFFLLWEFFLSWEFSSQWNSPLSQFRWRQCEMSRWDEGCLAADL